MCRWTENDNVIVFFIKWCVNTILFGIPGIVMYFIKTGDCQGLYTHLECKKMNMAQNVPEYQKMNMAPNVPE